MNTSLLRRTLTAASLAGGTAILMLGGIPAASAHVSVDPNKTEANSYALLTFGIPHGCTDSGTTKVTITLPQELNDATPTVNPNWNVEKVVQVLPEPRKLADGTTITKRTGQIVYTAKAPLDPHMRDALVLSVKLPDTAGKTLYFPTLQNCEQGQTDWAEIPEEGQNQDSLESPAPSIAVTAAAGDGHAHGAAAVDTTQATSVNNDGGAGNSGTGNDGGANVRSWTGLAAGVAGLGLGGAALLRGRTARTAKSAT
ncbi:YcnI family protein [Arthrobacter sp. ISL-30]|uniref:YcnI family copper-binding membrane protein n=1 Tax=Arthrobacter sp. ISL-30 TaxID=2819109 RepID=UPI001BE9157D|nr:YcnI family protein [Arthrobacter sp. ISL-30]MBT2515315.1 YcnI family protein [Arthrobacter sp. ISL-30]